MKLSPPAVDMTTRSHRWTGFVQPAFSEQYAFVVEANDGARLWIDGQLLFDNFDAVRLPFRLRLPENSSCADSNV